MMDPHSRKLQLVQPPYTDVSFRAINKNLSSPPPDPPLRPPYSNPPFDSSMALTVLVLLSALFFMGFFSIYIRRFSGEPTPEFTTHRRRQGTQSNQQPSRSVGGLSKGLEPEVISSLPVYTYYHGESELQTECAVCLGEFEEKDRVKILPFCNHVFHSECIDTWLEMHVSCPVCRGTQFSEVISKDGVGGGGLSAVEEDRVHEGDYRNRQVIEDQRWRRVTLV